ncbi:MAG: integrase arm-type DNA-binding domain-containing protein [Thermoanaerobaculia bacterium]|nr:integrase arm-type DNA-binding domain-containing protein [Thermoanaerobaculia bacterium]
MPKVKLTHRGIESFTAGKWLTDYMDDSLTGFGVRVHHTGKKVYFLRYIVDGTRRRMNLGNYPAFSLADARDRAKELIGRLVKGEDPQAEKLAERKAETFGELAAESSRTTPSATNAGGRKMNGSFAPTSCPSGKTRRPRASPAAISPRCSTPSSPATPP